MRDPSHWAELLTFEPAFTLLESKIRAGAIDDYRQIHPQAFGWHGWDLTPEARLFTMLLPFLRQQLARAKHALPVLYGEHLAGINPARIQTYEDWLRIPPLAKDNDPELGLRGFRALAQENPRALMPTDMDTAMVVFGSGGSQGANTPTFVTQKDRQREIHGWRRGHTYHGLVPGDRALYTYNTTHKGGQWMQESLWAHGVEVHVRRPEEGPEQVLENLHRYGVNVLFTVQQPRAALKSQSKAAGINLHSLVQASLENPEFAGLLLPDAEGRKQIEFVFLGGFEIVPYALELATDYLENIPIATLLGSSEAIPQACSTNPLLTPGAACHYNKLHLLHGPHYMEILKPEGDGWAPVEKGEQGMLAYTSWARDGTVWIRYAPGDLATKVLDEGECPCGLHTPVIAGVRRKDSSEWENLLLTGCAAG